jgi:hypothetical protein
VGGAAALLLANEDEEGFDEAEGRGGAVPPDGRGGLGGGGLVLLPLSRLRVVRPETGGLGLLLNQRLVISDDLLGIEANIVYEPIE